MERIVYKTNNFKAAEEWNILQQTQLTPKQRQEIALELRKRVYGTKSLDVKEAYKLNKKIREKNI
ncbi:MAG: hypothetical protein AB1414_02005 [bacterium]